MFTSGVISSSCRLVFGTEAAGVAGIRPNYLHDLTVLRFVRTICGRARGVVETSFGGAVFSSGRRYTTGKRAVCGLGRHRVHLDAQWVSSTRDDLSNLGG